MPKKYPTEPLKRGRGRPRTGHLVGEDGARVEDWPRITTRWEPFTKCRVETLAEHANVPVWVYLAQLVEQAFHALSGAERDAIDASAMKRYRKRKRR
jgi:hypothetical protein